MKASRYIFVLFLFQVTALQAQFTNLDYKVHNVGKVRQVITNMGTLDPALTDFPGLIFCEFPPNSKEEHLYQGGMWIGAINPDGDTLVSVTKTHYTPHEFYPTAALEDTIWVVAKGDTVDLPYWPDYVGISDQDFVCKYSDYNLLNIDDHQPLYLDVIQTSYAWASAPLDEFILFNYYITPTRHDLKDVYIAFWMHSEVGSINASDNYIDEYVYFYPEHQMTVAEDEPAGNDGISISPIGFKIVQPKNDEMVWSWKYYEHENLVNRDIDLYAEMSQGLVMYNRLDPARGHIMLAFGYIPSIAVGDTLRVTMAEVLGYGMEGLMANAEYIDFLASKDFRVPSPPPKPGLQYTIDNKQVHLSWHPTLQYNPETYQDPYRGDGETQPFEGYRLYKSTISTDGPWTLLAEYDIPGNTIGFNTGLNYEYIDTGLLNNVEYYYTLTAYSKPDPASQFPSQETSLRANAITVIPGTAAPETVGKVAVVPNPYRGDVAYNSYNPPWEKPGGSRDRWMEQDRRIQFINLPSKCEIKIYTLAGDLIDVIHHDNPDKGFEDWNLTSTIGQAISSGIYLFTVEDLNNFNVQTGKFVIIK
ncbi:hypothetical protein JW992_13620 [candidate division KSB1 bacterium]|nr:hypothetical protein [candidate division KSB1 bacterium]